MLLNQLIRYEDNYNDADVRVYERRFNIISQTDKTYLIDVWGLPKRVLKNANKRYAYPTVEEAWNSYGKRKAWQLRHGKNLVAHAERCLEIHKQGFANQAKDVNDFFEFE